MWLFALFIAVPLIEIALFIQVGGAIGLGWTLLVVVFTALIGTYLVRSQGAQALGQVQRSFHEFRDPTAPLAHGAMILFSGALLLTPGFFTDAVGFSLLVPGVREWIIRYVRSRMTVQHFATGPSAHHPNPAQDIIDGEFEEVPTPKSPTHQGSGWTRH